MNRLILFPYWSYRRFFFDGTPKYHYYHRGFSRRQKVTGYLFAFILCCLFSLAGAYLP